MNGFGMLSTRSGGGIFQPAVQCTAAGASAVDPSGAPAFTHVLIVAISPALSLASFANCPYRGSANQGGIFRNSTASRMAVAHGRDCWYDKSGIGPISPGR